MSEECQEKNIIEQAMEMEVESRDFYLNAAKKVENKLGRQMLESLADDESEHYKRLEQILEGNAETALGECEAEFSDGASRVRKLLNEFGAKAAQDIAADTDDLGALNMAMEMEKKGYDHYKEAALEYAGGVEEKVLVYLAGEEEKHFEVLQNMYRYLSDPANWFLEEEQGLLDGGD